MNVREFFNLQVTYRRWLDFFESFLLTLSHLLGDQQTPTQPGLPARSGALTEKRIPFSFQFSQSNQLDG